MPSLVQWKSRKKKNVDICNICLSEKEMTDDHVPPKGAIGADKLEVEYLFTLYAGSDELDHDEGIKQKIRFVQGGIKFRTICKDCHSKITRYDIELNNFSNTCRRLAKSGLIIPERTKFPFRPNSIIRALAGHFLSCTPEPDQSTFGKDARIILEDKNAPIPSYWNVYYWGYPYGEIRIAPRLLIMDPIDELYEPGFSYILKFFPLAFLICGNPNYWDLDCLSNFKGRSADFSTGLCPLPLISKHRKWPERNCGSFLTTVATSFGGIEGTRAVPYKKRPRP